MKTIDRTHHICLTVSSENFEEIWPKELAFFADFLGMATFKISVEEMDPDLVLQGLEEGMNLGPQTPVVYADDGRPIMDHFYYVAGKDLSETACLIDLIVFLCKPGQQTQTQPNMYTAGLRGLTLLADNVDTIYARGLEQGVEFLSEPVSMNWGDIGEVRYLVAKDPMGNAVELVQTDEVAQGDGEIIRIFSVNQNTGHLDDMLDFFVDGCGMSMEHRVEIEGEAFAKANGLAGTASATTCFLKGDNPDAKTFFSVTQWHDPVGCSFELKEGYTASYYRMWHWTRGGVEGAQELWDQMEPKMEQPMMAPYTYPSPRPWGDVTMSFFVDKDGAFHEFANHAEGGWDGLGGEVSEDPEFSQQFGVFER